jgi:hypothetical protein
MKNQDFRLSWSEPELCFGKPHTCHGVGTYQGSERDFFRPRQATRPNHRHAAPDALHVGPVYRINLEGMLSIRHLWVYAEKTLGQACRQSRYARLRAGAFQHGTACKVDPAALNKALSSRVVTRALLKTMSVSSAIASAR